MNFYKNATPMQESIILDSAKPVCSVSLAYNPWEPLSLYQNNAANAERG